MRASEIVEQGDRHQVITAPRHPYTMALIDALPDAEAVPDAETRTGAPGEGPA